VVASGHVRDDDIVAILATVSLALTGLQLVKLLRRTAAVRGGLVREPVSGPFPGMTENDFFHYILRYNSAHSQGALWPC